MNASSALTAQAPFTRWRLQPSRLQLTVALLFVAVGVRCLGLTLRPLWLDEAFSEWFSTRSWRYLWTIVPTFEAHPPFYYSVLKLWRSTFGGDALALRGLSVLLGVATVPVVIAAAFEQEKVDPTRRPLLRASAAGFLIACSPMLVALDQEARPYPLLVFGYALAILGLLQLVRQFSEGRAGDWNSWAILAVGSEITLWAHALGILYIACLGLGLAPAWLKRPVNGDRLFRGVGVAVAVALLFVPCLLIIASRSHDWGANWIAWNPLMLLQLVSLYSVPEVTSAAFVTAAALLLLQVKRAIERACVTRGWNVDRQIMALWLGPPLVSALVSALFIPVFLPRTLAGTLVPASLAIAGALARTPSRRERTLLAIATCASLIPATVHVALRPASERWDLVASYLARNAAPTDQVWLYPSDSALPLAKAGVPISAPLRAIPAPFPTLGVRGPIRAGWPAVVSVTPQQAAGLATDPTIEKLGTIWLVTRQSAIFDPASDIPSALGRTRRPGAIASWDYIEVRPYYRR
jgi:hypothetical protein